MTDAPENLRDDPRLPVWWSGARQAFADHISSNGPGCSFGGMSMGGWYWLVTEGCELNHGDTCAACGEEAAGPVRWREWDSRIEMWEVPVCEKHAAQIPGLVKERMIDDG